MLLARPTDPGLWGLLTPVLPGGLTAFEKIFQFDVALPDDYRPSTYGGRVFVRIDHGTEPIAVQLYWAVRQVFLNRFGV